MKMINSEEIMNDAKEALDKIIESIPEEGSNLIRNNQETFIMGFILGRTNNDLKICKEYFPELDWDSSIGKLLFGFTGAIKEYLGEEMKK